MKISAIGFSLAGDRYLGRKYEEMDCQAFVEKCMADVGLRMDLGGSNSWYREVMKHGWAGPPEECARRFGSVPKGALLFILEPVSADTPAKFRSDGVGDAAHMGIVTGRGEGAIHSSQSKGGVVNSRFRGQTIPNGGWNRVGLYDRFDYGEAVNEALGNSGNKGTRPVVTSSGGNKGTRPVVTPSDGNKGTRPVVTPSGGTTGLSPTFPSQPSQEKQTEQEEKKMNVIIQAENGGPVKLRQSCDPKSSGYSIWEEYPSGSRAEVLRAGEEWSRIRIGNRSGWMMSRFLTADDGEIPAEPEESGTEADGEEGDEALALLAEVYRALRDLCDRIEETAGVG